MRRRSIELVILVPVLIFLIFAGTSFYFFIKSSVKVFVEKIIHENLSSMSKSLYNIADKTVDYLNKTGERDERWIRIYQASVLMEIEDFSRQNDIGIIVYSLKDNKFIFTVGTSEEVEETVKEMDLQGNRKFPINSQETYYFRSVIFNPWEWHIVLAKDASAFAYLENNLTFYLVAGIIILVAAIFLFAYLRYAIGYPIIQIVKSVKRGEPPQYKGGIDQLKVLNESFAQYITLCKQSEQELLKQQGHLEDLVRARTAELMQAIRDLEEANKQLQEAKILLEEANQAKSRTIYELKEANRQLEKAKTIAEKAKKAKSDFLTSVSHDLRAPQDRIKTYTDSIRRQLKNILPDKEYENLQKVLDVSYEEASRLINDLLDFSKKEVGEIIQIHRERFNLNRLIDECLYMTEYRTKGKMLRLIKELEVNESSLHTDKEKVKRIIYNLLTNAFKFTLEGTIKVTTRYQKEMVSIIISDTGIGIPQEKQELVFQKYYQIDGQTYKGTGIGLAISRHLAHLMGGDITVESAVDIGSAFTVRIPIHYTDSQIGKHLSEIPDDLGFGAALREGHNKFDD